MQKREECLTNLTDSSYNKKNYPLEICIRDTFLKHLNDYFISGGSVTALSVSIGYGKWDYFALSNYGERINKIIATDVVDNPVIKEDIEILKKLGDWEFKKVEAEKPLSFSSEYFEIIYHGDVIEHVIKPYLFISEQYRVLKKDGILILGTPNIFRPGNILKLLIGRLFFPLKLGFDKKVGDCVHIQEFNEFQLKNLLEEIGFKEIEIKHCYFGIWPLKITFSLYPKGKIGKGMCHYLMVKCRK